MQIAPVLNLQEIWFAREFLLPLTIAKNLSWDSWRTNVYMH